MVTEWKNAEGLRLARVIDQGLTPTFPRKWDTHVPFPMETKNLTAGIFAGIQ